MEPNFGVIQGNLNRRKFPVVLVDNQRKEIKHVKDLAEVVHKLLVKRYETFLRLEKGYKHHCYAHRARSIQDLYLVAKNYKHDLTYEQLYNIIQQIRTPNCSDRVKILNFGYCYTTRREVHSPMNLSITEDKVREVLGKTNILF